MRISGNRAVRDTVVEYDCRRHQPDMPSGSTPPGVDPDALTAELARGRDAGMGLVSIGTVLGHGDPGPSKWWAQTPWRRHKTNVQNIGAENHQDLLSALSALIDAVSKQREREAARHAQ